MRKKLPFLEANWSLLTPREHGRLMAWAIAFYIPTLLGLASVAVIAICWWLGLAGSVMFFGCTVAVVKTLGVPQGLGGTAYESLCGLDIVARYALNGHVYQFKRTLGFIYLVEDGWVLNSAAKIPDYFVDEGIVDELEQKWRRPIQAPYEAPNLDIRPY
jgi:hypothetical protein